MTVTEITTSRYTLSDWIRGQYGTENYIDGHGVGDLLFRLNPSDIGVLEGDHNIFRSSLNKYTKKFVSSKVDAMILLCEVNDPSRFGIAELDGKKIKKIIR